MSTWSRLVRFVAKDGRKLYGDAILPSGVTDIARATKATVIEGGPWSNYKITQQTEDIQQLLAPLAREDISSVRGLGLNYAKHAKEANMPEPKYPVLFYKPISAVTGPRDPIPVPAIAQEAEGVDYECELVIVIGKKCKDVPKSEALKYVGGYAIGNDVSQREWQLKRGGGQWCLGKGFDGWAPFGPGIVSPSILKDAHNLKISTLVNGKTMQESNTRDMIFGVAETISFLSRGTTLLPGDLIFTGTPEGVGMGQNPPLWLKDGDVVEVSLEGVGACSNKVVHEQTDGKVKSRL